MMLVSYSSHEGSRKSGPSVICIQPQVIQRHGINLKSRRAHEAMQTRTLHCAWASLILRMMSSASLTSRFPFNKPQNDSQKEPQQAAENDG